MKRVALAGNPNCGKTTLFNSLTGSTAYVGNWPGVTVEKRSGTFHFKGKSKSEGMEVVDLPGIYSLSPYTPEEVISRNYILNEKPDVVINVLDGTNLERNLYMTTQILEMDVPVVVAINMTDAMKENGLSLDTNALSKALGVPVVSISALRNKGLTELMKAAEAAAETKRSGTSVLPYAILEKAKAVYEEEGISNALFHAIKALEKDEIEAEEHKEAYAKIETLVKGDSIDYEAGIADERYKYLTPLVAKVLSGAKKQSKEKLSRSDKIDRVLTNKWAGLPILVVLLFAIFHIVFASDLFYLGKMGVNFGEGYQGFIVLNVGGEEFRPFAGLFYDSDGIASLGEFLHRLAGDSETGILGCISLGIKQLLLTCGVSADSWAMGLVYDGVLAGVTAVLGFVPQIMLLFAFFSILEDSGYMARAAFILDRIFRRFGVSGRAFIPMIMGFGCGVPAMMNTRTLGSDKERTKTIRVIPFFTCGAKAEFLAVIAATVAAAVHIDEGLFTFLMYAIGVIVGMAAVIVMNKTTQREKVPPFIMELPPYHAPQFHATIVHVWDKGKHFIKKAFTLILVSTIVVWFFANFDWSWNLIGDESTSSILASLGKLIQPIFTPLGFGVQAGADGWVFTVSSIQGIIAKENVTAVTETLAQVVGVEGFDGLVAHCGLTTAAVVAFAVFNMLTIPCFASVATAKSELVDRKAYIGTLIFWIGTSYVMGAITYVTLQWVWTLAISLPVLAGGIVGLYFYDRHMKKVEAKKEAEAAA